MNSALTPAQQDTLHEVTTIAVKTRAELAETITNLRRSLEVQDIDQAKLHGAAVKRHGRTAEALGLKLAVLPLTPAANEANFAVTDTRTFADRAVELLAAL